MFTAISMVVTNDTSIVSLKVMRIISKDGESCVVRTCSS